MNYTWGGVLVDWNKEEKDNEEETILTAIFWSQNWILQETHLKSKRFEETHLIKSDYFEEIGGIWALDTIQESGFTMWSEMDEFLF